MVKIQLKITALIPRLFYVSFHVGSVLSLSLHPLGLLCFPKVCFSCTSAGKLGVRVWLLCCLWGDVCSLSEENARSHTSASAHGCAWAMAAWLAGQTSLRSADARGKEQSNCICPFAKENLSIVPSVLQLREA